MLSIVTGTLNRSELLPDLIKNTVNANNNLELILVDGGSTDDTLSYIKKINHPKIKLIEVGHRSSYPHFMNLGIKHASYEWICQWNDDVLLINNWNEVLNELVESKDFYLFNWKYGTKEDINNEEWLKGIEHTQGWCIVDNTPIGDKIVMNYGIYRKDIFKKIGLYNSAYHYYYADGDMCQRAYIFGFKHKALREIKVCSVITSKKAQHNWNDESTYQQMISLYKKKQLPESIEFLT